MHSGDDDDDDDDDDDGGLKVLYTAWDSHFICRRCSVRISALINYPI